MAFCKKKYASKIKITQETQLTQENYASSPCVNKNATIEEPILFFTQRMQAAARRNAWQFVIAVSLIK